MRSVQVVAAVATALGASHPNLKVRFANLTLPADQLGGCIGHPNVQGHATLLQQLEPVLREVTGW